MLHYSIKNLVCHACVHVCLTRVTRRVEKSNYYIPAEHKTDARVSRPSASDVIHPVLRFVKGRP